MPKLIISHRYYDNRGFFAETYNKKQYLDDEINVEFVQDNHSLSDNAGTIRGLHFQAPPCAQAKIVRCVRGAIFDIVVDIRRGSPKYGRWESYELTADNGHQLYVPIGFAHGFMTLRPNSEIVYKCSNYYAPETEGSILWSDPEIGIDWPFGVKPILSNKDDVGILLKDFESPFIFGKNS